MDAASTGTPATPQNGSRIIPSSGTPERLIRSLDNFGSNENGVKTGLLWGRLYSKPFLS